MTIKDPTYWKRLAKANIVTVNGILWFGFLYSITAIGLSFTGESTFGINNIKIPLQFAWIPLLLFTLLHFIYTKRFENATRNYWSLTSYEEYSELFKDITSEGGYFMRELYPRNLFGDGKPAPMKNEISSWLAYITAIVLFLALWQTVNLDFPFFDLPPNEIYWWEKFIPLILTYANWLIGSRWAIILSELAVKKKYSVMLAGIPPSAMHIPNIYDENNENDKNQ